MTRARIGGKLTYEDMAMLYRPADPALIAAECMRLHETGLTANDIAMALRMPSDQVRNILGSISTTSMST